MSLFKRFFGTQKSSDSFKNNNFQDHNLPSIQIALKGDFKQDVMTAITELGKELKKINSDYGSTIFLYTKLTKEGIIRIPVVFTVQGLVYGLFYINTSDQAKFYNYLLANPPLLGKIVPIYLSTIDLAENTEVAVNIKSMQWTDLEFDEQAKLSGEYAIWWSSLNDTSFSHSKTKMYLEEMYNLIDGFEEYFFGHFLFDIKMKGFPEPKKVSLPQNDYRIAVNAPENKVIIIAVSQEKGIRFLFPIQDTSLEYRHSFLKQLLLTFKQFNEMLLKADYPKNQKQDLNGLEWFTLMANSQVKMENQEDIKIGLLTIN